jgi:hypothetical protein
VGNCTVTTDAGGHVTFTLPFGAHRFRADIACQ